MNKKNDVLHKCVTVATATVLGACLVGCGPLQKILPKTPEPKSVAIVVQNTSGAPLWTMPKDVLDAIDQVSDTAGVVTVTIADGSPTSTTFDFSQSAGSAINQKRMLKKVDAALAATADDAGCDMLKSVEIGAASLAGYDNPIGLYVISNGLSDKGLLDMTSGLLVEGDPDQVAEFYEAKNELADLSHTGKVTWFGMGSTAGKQAAPSNAQVAAIRSLWDKILAKCGTSLDARQDSVADTGEREGAPKVNAIPFESAQVFDASALEQTTTVEFTPTQLGFVGDSCEFVDAEQARTSLVEVANALRQNPKLHATVVASAATHPKEGYAQQLSEERAAAVKDTLVSLSVPEGQVTAKGVGSGEPDDIDPETGLQIPQKSAAKRRVTIELASL